MHVEQEQQPVDPIENPEAQPAPEAAPAEPAQADPESTVEGGEAAAPDDAAEEQKSEKSGFQKRIDELTREKYEAQRQAEQIRAENEAIRQQMLQAQYQGEDEPFPTLEDAGYDEQRYQQEIQGWYARRQQDAFQRQQYAEAARQQAEQQAKQAAELRSKVQEAVHKYPDFLVKIQDPQLPNLAEISPAAFEAVSTSEHFGDVSYYLAQNPAEVYKLRDMSPLAAVRAIAKLEAKFEAKTQTNPNTPPPPPSRVKGKGGAEKDPSKMSIDEFMAWRNKA